MLEAVREQQEPKAKEPDGTKKKKKWTRWWWESRKEKSGWPDKGED